MSQGKLLLYLLGAVLAISIFIGLWGVALQIALLAWLTPLVSDVRLNLPQHSRLREGRRSAAALATVVIYGGLSGLMGWELLGEIWHLHSFWDTLLACGIGAGGLGFWLYASTTTWGNPIMHKLFDLVDDPQALQAFVGQESAGQAQGAGACVHDLHAFHDELPELIAALQERVIGQDEIVSDVTGYINRRIDMQRETKPLGVFLFVGATGAGKTELAKALAEGIFGPNKLLRFDCNEMTEASSTQRLIGAPPGYVGSDQGGQLTRGIIANRTGVILFDEIEKAHPDVYKTLMTLMDEGRITEQSTGQVADASGHVIILTSNAAHERIAQIVKDVHDDAERRGQVKDALAGVFKPEQLARIDEIYAFGQLARLSMARIVAKLLSDMAASAGMTLEKVDTALIIDAVVQHERMAQYGIRELVRVIERKIGDELYTRRREGFKSIAIRVAGEQISVVGLQAQQQTQGA